MLLFLICREETFFLVLLRNINHEISLRLHKVREGMRVKQREREKPQIRGSGKREKLPRKVLRCGPLYFSNVLCRII